MVDLGKYQDKVKYGQFNWPVQFCTIGKKIPNPGKRKETLVKEMHFDTLFRILKFTDWVKAPVYESFRKHGRWNHNNDDIYSEIELKYLHGSLSHMINE